MVLPAHRGGVRGGIGALWLLCTLLLLTGCASLPTRSPDTMPVLSWSQRLLQLQDLRHFDLQGKVGVSTGSDGFSAGLRWQQNDDQASIDLSAPLGFGAAHIQQTEDILRVTTSKGVILDDRAANDELRATLGFDAPLRSLRYWVVGASDPASQAQETVDADQRLSHLQQDGWQVQYGDYTLVSAVPTPQWLPLSLTVTRETLRLKIVIHNWKLYSILGD
jgi:outer membrane lipoprotein LolB